MSNHEKSHLCRVCRGFKHRRDKWISAPCRDCGSYCSSYAFYELATAQDQVRELQYTLKLLNRKHNSLLRWIMRYLRPMVEKTTPDHNNSPFLLLMTQLDK